MKYCKICKTAAKETDTTCVKGHPLSIFGAGPKPAPSTHSTKTPAASFEPPGPAASPSPVMFTLMGEVQKLQAIKKQHVKRGRTFAFLSLTAALAIVVVVYQVYARTVLSYAILENIRVEQDPRFDWKINISYDVKTPGQVAFDRQSGTKRIEKRDVIGQVGPTGFTWAWPSDPKTGIDFHVYYRDGWLLNSHDRHFQVTTAKPRFVN